MSALGALALLGLLQAIPASPPLDAPETVVVIGRRPKVTGAELAACLARGCPPKEDIALSLAHAQAQFVAGDYQASRRTLLAARKRNREHAGELPVEVAGLHRANAELADLNGLRDQARSGLFDTVDALKEGLSRDNDRVLLARMEIGAAYARAGRLDDALRQYSAVARAARKANAREVEGLALFRSALLLAAAASQRREYRHAARTSATLLTQSTEPTWQPFRNAIRIVPALLAPEQDRAGLLDQAIAAMEPQVGGKPVLIYAPPIDLRYSASLPGETTVWMDVGYRIGSDGRVHDVALRRASPNIRTAWIDRVAAALGQRRYAPFVLPAGAANPEHVERISFVSDLNIDWGSRASWRSVDRRADARDLAADLAEER